MHHIAGQLSKSILCHTCLNSKLTTSRCLIFKLLEILITVFPLLLFFLEYVLVVCGYGCASLGESLSKRNTLHRPVASGYLWHLGFFQTNLFGVFLAQETPKSAKSFCRNSFRFTLACDGLKSPCWGWRSNNKKQMLSRWLQNSQISGGSLVLYRSEVCSGDEISVGFLRREADFKQ